MREVGYYYLLVLSIGIGDYADAGRRGTVVQDDIPCFLNLFGTMFTTWIIEYYYEITLCCEPEIIVPSILESDIKPPLDQPPSKSTKLPFICMRRKGVAWDVAHLLVPPSGVTAIPATDLQKVHVAFPRIQSASE